MITTAGVSSASISSTVIVSVAVIRLEASSVTWDMEILAFRNGLVDLRARRELQSPWRAAYLMGRAAAIDLGVTSSVTAPC